MNTVLTCTELTDFILTGIILTGIILTGLVRFFAARHCTGTVRWRYDTKSIECGFILNHGTMKIRDQRCLFSYCNSSINTHHSQ